MIVRNLTGLDDVQLFDLRFETGERYLKEQLNGDETAFKRLINSGFFWNWWNGQWGIRDEWFLSLNKEKVVNMEWAQEGERTMADKYTGFHRLELGQPHLAHGLVHIKVKYAGCSAQPTKMAIIQQVAWECEVTRTMILGKSRKQKVVYARHMAAKLIREAGNSLKQTAMALKRGHHSTILNSEAQADALLETDKDFLTIYSKIKLNLWQDEQVKQLQRN